MTSFWAVSEIVILRAVTVHRHHISACVVVEGLNRRPSIFAVSNTQVTLYSPPHRFTEENRIVPKIKLTNAFFLRASSKNTD